VSYDVLKDPGIIPDEDFIASHLGQNSILWNSLFDSLRSDYPELSGSWKYYSDVKSWLYKCVQSSKTVFWLSLIDGTFRVTFYFNAKNQNAVFECGIPEHFKKLFRETNENKKFKNMTVAVNSGTDVETVLTLVKVKRRCL